MRSLVSRNMKSTSNQCLLLIPWQSRLWFKCHRRKWSVLTKTPLAQEFNLCRNNYFNQASFRECALFSSWQSRPWFKCNRGKWSTTRETPLAKEVNRFSKNDFNQNSFTECLLFNSW
jgi:uncharacterized protein (DUF2461 family)